MDAGKPIDGRIEGEGVNHYPHHIGDYLKDTAHLSLLEHGCYRRMLDVYYSREKAFADAGEACKLIGARTSQERAAVQLVLSDYFVQEADGFHQKRCDEELESYAAKANANRENGKKGGRPVTQAKPTNNPSGFDSLTQNNLNQNQNQNQIKEGQIGAEAPLRLVDETSAKVFTEGVTLLTNAGDSERSARTLLGKLRRDHGDEAVLSVIRRANETSISNPKDYLVGALRPKGARLAL